MNKQDRHILNTAWLYRLSLFIIIVIGGISFFHLYQSLKKGIGISPDSVEYLYAAKTYISGEGLRSINSSIHHPMWLTHFPPGISLCYGFLAKLFGISDILLIAGIANLVFFLLTVLLVSKLVLAGTNNKWLSLFAALFMLTSIDGFCIFQMLWSEPMFLFFALLSLYILHRYIETKSMTFLILSATLISMACMIRYVGITLIFTGCFVVFFQTGANRISNFWRTFCFGIISSTLVVSWALRNYLLQHTMTDRTCSYHPMTGDYLHDFLHTVKSFYLQLETGPVTIYLGIALFAGLLFFIFLLTKKKSSFLNTHSLARILLLFGIIYLLFICLSNTFFDFTPLYYRILYLPFLCFLMVFLMYISSLIPRLKWNTMRGKLIVYFTGLFFLGHVVSFRNFLSADKEPEGLNTTDWKNSEMAAFIMQMPQDALIYSSEYDAIYIVTDKVVNSLHFIAKDRALNRGRKQYIACFKSGRITEGSTYNDPVTKDMGFSKVILLKEFTDGKIYEVY